MLYVEYSGDYPIVYIVVQLVLKIYFEIDAVECGYLSVIRISVIMSVPLELLNYDLVAFGWLPILSFRIKLRQ